MTQPALNSDQVFRLPREVPEYFAPKEILYVTLSFDVDSQQRLNFRFSPALAFDMQDIKQFLADKFANPPTLPASPKTAPTGPKSLSPLEIWVSKPCWVVIELTPAMQQLWRFRASGPALTGKADYGIDTCGVKHIGDKGEVLSDHGPGPNCRLIYFAVCQRGAAERQSFNLHMGLEQEDNSHGELEIMIDPDVPDNGGGFPMF